MFWKILNKIDLTKRIDNFAVKYFSYDKNSKRIDFSFEEAWRVFRYSLRQPTWEEYLENTKIVTEIFILVGVPYMLITILIKLFL